MAYFSQTAHAITPRGIGKIKSLTIRLYITDCSAATENILLAAKALGLDTCWLGIYPHKDMQEAFSKEFNLPKNIIPFAAIALGYGDEKKERPERFDAKKIHYNKW